jgi:hypothetical protein
MKARNIIIAIVCGIFAVSAAGAQEKFPKPKKSEVIIIGRVVVTPAIDDAFYSKYWKLNSRTLKTTPPKEVKKGEVVHSKVILTIPEGWTVPFYDVGTVGDLFFVKMNPHKDRLVPILDFTVWLGGLSFLELHFPIMGQAMIPEGENYAYVGTFVYQRDGNLFRIVDSGKLDEFDEVQKAVAEHYGSEAKVIRVPLTPFDPETKK